MRYSKQLKGLKKQQLIEQVRPKLNKYIKFSPTAKQQALLLLNEYLEVFFGGAAGGSKTTSLLMAALQFVDVPGYNALLVRDTYSNLSKPDSLIPMSHEWLSKTDAYWKGTDRLWKFPSGATLSFGHLDTPNSHFDYQSAQFQYVGLDEVVAIRENQAMYLFSRMRKIKGKDCPIRFRCASNPPAREQIARGEWVKRRYVDDKTRAPNVIFLPAWMSDNPHLDINSYKESLAKLDDVTRRQLEEGDWNVKAKGKIFDPKWFEVIEAAPVKVASRVRYWDFAATEKTADNNPCFTAGVKMSRTKDREYIVEDVKRIQGKPSDVEKLVKSCASLDETRTKIWIEQEPGSSGITVISHYIKALAGYTIRGDRATGSKIERAHPLSIQAEAGNVKIVKGTWNREYLDELELFPDGPFKDQTDASSGAFNKLAFGLSKARAKVVGDEDNKQSPIDEVVDEEIQASPIEILAEKGFVPITCTLPWEFAYAYVMGEILTGKSPCLNCTHNKKICKGS